MPELTLAREELWVLTRAAGRPGLPGLTFEDLESLPEAERHRLQTIMERVLWARGLLARDQEGRPYLRKKAWDLLEPALGPEVVYFYGQRDEAGREDVMFFYKNAQALVACAQIAPQIYHITTLPQPQWIVRIVSTGMRLLQYKVAPPQVPAVKIPVTFLEALQQRVRQAPEEMDQLRQWMQKQIPEFPEDTLTLLLESLREFQKYHALSRVPYPEVDKASGFAFLQSTHYLWYLEPQGDKERLLKPVHADFVLKRLQSFFE